MISVLKISVILVLIFGNSCNEKETIKKVNQNKTRQEVTAKEILGNPDYQAISYGGYRQKSRDIQPTVDQIKEDMKILSAMGIRVLRTYNTELKHASTILEAIHQLKEYDPNFEMYLMLGVWINCENAFTSNPNHNGEDEVGNAAEIERAVNMANKYPDIVKIIAVGNEAMVKWAASYFVQPWVILKWVNHLQELKSSGKISKDLWITSSDNFASWGGGEDVYHTDELKQLMQAVDYISLHTYPMHDTHYNPIFWGVSETESGLSELDQIVVAMKRALEYTQLQYRSTVDYINSQGINKPVHIGETGWASYSNGYYGSDGSKATDEYKESIYYKHLRDWTNKAGISCFYFEAFDEIWKDANNSGGSENHFGLFNIKGQAKYALWELVDQGVFEGLSRDGNPITKTYNGSKAEMMKEVLTPPIKIEIGILQESNN